MADNYWILGIASEGCRLPFERKILIRDKRHFGGHSYIQGADDVYIKHPTRRIAKWIKNFQQKTIGRIGNNLPT